MHRQVPLLGGISLFRYAYPVSLRGTVATLEFYVPSPRNGSGQDAIWLKVRLE